MSLFWASDPDCTFCDQVWLQSQPTFSWGRSSLVFHLQIVLSFETLMKFKSTKKRFFIKYHVSGDQKLCNTLLFSYNCFVGVNKRNRLLSHKTIACSYYRDMRNISYKTLPSCLQTTVNMVIIKHLIWFREPFTVNHNIFGLLYYIKLTLSGINQHYRSYWIQQKPLE